MTPDIIISQVNIHLLFSSLLLLRINLKSNSTIDQVGTKC